MPNTLNKFSAGVIYKIESPKTECIYIGSTINVSNRVSHHKWLQNQSNTGQTCKNIRSLSITKLDDWKLEVIENYPCESKKQLESRERYWIENTPSRINHIIPTRSTNEYRQTNEEQKEKHRQRENARYYANRVTYKARFAEKIQCPKCNSQISRIHLSRHQQTKKCIEAAMLVGL